MSVTAPAPPSYLDLRFQLPDPPQKRWVGMLACQRDPLLRKLVTTVVRCDKVASQRAPFVNKGRGKGKKDKAGQQVQEVALEEEWEVELLDTPLFPEGGGQPSDTGYLYPLSSSTYPDSAPVRVRQVLRRNFDAVHFVDRSLDVGSEVRAEVDWFANGTANGEQEGAGQAEAGEAAMEGGREDRMVQHLGQHLLSAVLEQTPFSLETLSWSLTAAPNLCYLELPVPPSHLTPALISQVQIRVNELIKENRKVRVRMEFAGGEDGVELGDKVPDNYKEIAEGGEGRRPVHRTVLIEGLDENPCCGTHPPSLSHLQLAYLSPYPSLIRSTNSRLYFAFGRRALTFLSSAFISLREAALIAGCGVEGSQLRDKVEGLVVSGRDEVKREKKLVNELATYVARDVFTAAAAAANARTLHEGDSGDGEGAILSHALLREEDSTNSLDFLSAVATELGTLISKTNTQSGGKGTATTPSHLLLLAAGPSPSSSSSSSTSSSPGALLVIGSPPTLVADAGQKVVERLGKDRIKGGGKGRWQGKIAGGWVKGDESLLRGVVEDLVGTTA
ncbi:hypothetical protein JCM11641_002442 [Rhodosporidiobolus odoratus]